MSNIPPKTVSTRMLLEQTIVDLLEAYPNLVHVTTDGKDYVDKHVDRRFDVGIAESNLINVASGFSLKGFRVVVNGIASFVLYNAYLQIRNNISHHSLGVVIIGVGSGLSYGHLGSTHHALEDIATMYTLPEMDIYFPVDGLEAARMLRHAVELNRPAYIRIRTGQEPVVSDNEIYEKAVDFSLPILARQGSDVLMICYGGTVSNVLRASEILEGYGISAAVLNLRMLSDKSIHEAVAYVERFKHVITIEEHYADTGVGSILANGIENRHQHSIVKMGVDKKISPYGGTPEELFLQHNLDVDSIVNKVTELSSKKLAHDKTND